MRVNDQIARNRRLVWWAFVCLMGFFGLCALAFLALLVRIIVWAWSGA